MIAVLSMSFAAEEPFNLADEILSAASERGLSALSLCVTANVEQRGGK